ncbi:MAG TPA: alpha/beta hydrolase [Burkholderiales bacterium]|nr:alpha/beta hydrolase [Burkholderiales bacterium]
MIDGALWEEYDVEGHSPRMQEWREEYARRSRRAYAALACQRDIPYGAHPRETLDFFPAAQPGSRVLVYIHGGFWRRGDKRDSAHLAAAFVPAGWNFATVEYPLLPETGFAQIVAAVRRLADALPSLAAAQHIAEPRFVLSGHSAGAHLAFNAAAHLRGRIAGLILTGGVYDLAPLVRTPAQEWLQLTAEEAERFSPAKIPPWPPQHPILIAVGADDRPGLRRQALALHRRFQQAGHDSKFMVTPGDCHFSIIGRMADPGHALGHATASLLDPVNAVPERDRLC